MKKIEGVGTVPLSTTLLLNLVFGGRGFNAAIHNSWLKVFVRMVDRSIQEYLLAAHYWREQYAPRTDGNFALSLPQAGDHLESCVISLDRALRCLVLLLTRTGVDFSRDISLDAVSEYQRILRPTRNAIAHIEERIEEFTQEDQPHTLLINEQGTSARIHDAAIDLDGLHACLTSMLETAKHLVSFDQSSAPP